MESDGKRGLITLVYLQEKAGPKYPKECRLFPQWPKSEVMELPKVLALSVRAEYAASLAERLWMLQGYRHKDSWL